MYSSMICDPLVLFRLQIFHKDFLAHSVARLAPGRHLTLITAHAQVCALCVTVTTMPIKCNVLSKSDPRGHNCDSLLTLSLAPAREPFSSYLHDVQALILPRTQVDLPSMLPALVVMLFESEKAVEYKRSVISMSALVLCPLWARDYVCGIA